MTRPSRELVEECLIHFASPYAPDNKGMQFINTYDSGRILMNEVFSLRDDLKKAKKNIWALKEMNYGMESDKNELRAEIEKLNGKPEPTNAFLEGGIG